MKRKDFIKRIGAVAGVAAMSVSALDFTLSAGDIAELEHAVESIPVIGDRYDAEQQKRVLG